mgnify:CR=1 FL=1
MNRDINTLISLAVDGEERTVQAFGRVAEAGQRAGARIKDAFEYDDIDRLEAALDPAVAKLQDYEKALRLVSRAVEEGRLTQERANELLVEAERRYEAVGRGGAGAFQALESRVEPALAALRQFRDDVATVEAAVDSGATSLERGVEVLDRVEAGYRRAASGVAAIEDRLDPALAAYRRFSAEVETVSDALDRGAISQDRAARVLDDLADSYARAERAADEAAFASAQASFGRIEDRLDPAAAAARRLEADIEAVNDALARGAVDQERGQAAIEGLRREFNEAAEAARRAESAFSLDEVQRLEAALDPTTAALYEYRRAQHVVAQAVREGRLEQARANEVLVLAERRFAAMSVAGRAGVNRVGDVMQQVGYQVSDFAIQIASGQAALLAFSQQAPQLFQAFRGPVGIALTLASAIGGALAISLMSGARVAKTLADRLGELDRALGDVGANTTAADNARGLVETYGTIDEALITLIQRAREADLALAEVGLGQALGATVGAAEAADPRLAYRAERGERERGPGPGLSEIEAAADLGVGRENVRAIRMAVQAVRDAGSDLAAQRAAVGALGDAVVEAAAIEGSASSLDKLSSDIQGTLLRARAFDEAGRKADAAQELEALGPAALNALAAPDAGGGGGGGAASPARGVLADLRRDFRRVGMSERQLFVSSQVDRAGPGEDVDEIRRAAAALYDRRQEEEALAAARQVGTDLEREAQREQERYIEAVRDRAIPRSEQYAEALKRLHEVRDRLTDEEFSEEIRRINRELGQGAEVGDLFGNAVGSALDTIVERGFEARTVLDAVMQTLRGGAMEMFQSAILDPLRKRATSAFSSAIGSITGSIAGGAFGGEFVVPGYTGHDSVTALLKVSPGETVSVRQRDAAGGSGGGHVFHFHGPVGDGVLADPAGAMGPAVAELTAQLASAASRGGRTL